LTSVDGEATEVVIRDATTPTVIVAMIVVSTIEQAKTADMMTAPTIADIGTSVVMMIEATDGTMNEAMNVANAAEMIMLETDTVDEKIATAMDLAADLEATIAIAMIALTEKHLDLGILLPLVQAMGSPHLAPRVERPTVALEIIESCTCTNSRYSLESRN
jgi:hypothetical protein